MKDDIKVLILGSTGYIGSYLFNSLYEDGINVYGSGRKVINDERYIYLDLLSKEHIAKVLADTEIDIIINAVGYVDLSKSGDGEVYDKLYEGNVKVVKNIVEVLGNGNFPKTKLIHLSTMSVYGKAKHLPVDEEHPVDPISLYGITKLTGDLLIKYYSETLGVNSLILRLPGVFGGDRKSGAIFNFIKNCLKQEEVVINTIGLKGWDTIYIKTLSNIILKLILSYNWDTAFKILNISYGSNVDIIETAKLIKKITNSQSNIMIKEPLDYKPFFMSDAQLRRIILSSYEFEKDVFQYVNYLKGNCLI